MYYITAFNKDGEKVLDEQIFASDDQEAKKKGWAMLEEQQPHRIFSSTGQLISFYPHSLYKS